MELAAHLQALGYVEEFKEEVDDLPDGMAITDMAFGEDGELILYMEEA